jgi:hypothetical protein
MDQKPDSNKLPIQGNLGREVKLTFIVIVLMAFTSIGSLIFTSIIYPTEELFQSFAINDVTNLIIGVPILLGSMWLAKRDKLVGLLLWPGALLYVLYNYIVYVFGIRFNVFTLVYLALVLLSAFVIFDLILKMEMEKIRAQLSGNVPVRFASWVLLLFGAFFVFRAIGIIVEAITTQKVLPLPEIGLLIADILLSTVWIVGGVSLLRRTPVGYSGGLALLFMGSMLFIGLILVLCISPLMSEAEFVLADVVIVTVMGLICFILATEK